MQKFVGPGRMRIRKPHQRNSANTIVRVPPEDVAPVAVGPLLKLGWDGDGRSNVTTSTAMEGELIQTTTTTGTGTWTEQSGLGSVTTISRQSASPGVSMLHRGHVVEEPTMSKERGMKSEPDMAVRPGDSRNDDVDDIVNNGAEPEGSTLSVEQLWQGQDGEEHVTRHYVRRSNATRKGGDGPALAPFESSMAAAARPSALESNGNDGIKQTCKSEKWASAHVKIEIPSSEMRALKRKLPLETDQDSSETESEGEAVHPSTAPEGSVLHTLYLQLLAAGSEGITLRELFASFKKQTALPSLASDWKEQVRAHLKNNPHFDEVKGYFLLCEQLVQPKRSSGSLNRPYLGVSPRTTTSGRHLPPLRTTAVQSTDSSAAAAQPNALTLQKHEGVQTRRKAYEKTIEAVLTESAIEFQKMQESLGNMQVTAVSDTRADSNFIKADLVDSQAAQTPLPTSRKRKSSSDNEELDTYSKTIRGSLQALQARIVAETGVQKGVPCSRKDDARKWRCPLMAMEGHTLCEHHKTLQLRKRVKKQEDSKLARQAGTKKTKLIEAEPCLTTDKEDIVAGLSGVHAVEALMDLQGSVREGEYQGVVQPSRISFHNTVDEAEAMEEDSAPNQVEKEESEVFLNNSSKTVHTTNTTTTPTFNGTSRTSQTPSDSEPDEVHRNVHYERAIPGSLKALQAKILEETGEQSGVRCARKDGSNDSARKWQCPLDALPGHTLCQHHNLLKERKRARYAAAKKKKDKMKLAGGQRRGPDTTVPTTASNEDMGLPVRTTQFDALPARSERRKSSEKGESHRDDPVRKPRLNDRARSPVADETVDHDESTDTEDEHIVEPAKRISIIKPKDPANDDSNNVIAERLLPQVFKNAPKKRYVAAKKTAANVDVVKEKSQERETPPLIRPPTIPPLPAMYGVRRKAVKNRSLLSL